MSQSIIKATKDIHAYPVGTKYLKKDGGYYVKFGEHHFSSDTDEFSEFKIENWTGEIIMPEPPQFVQSCILHKNTEEIGHKLEELGWMPLCLSTNPYILCDVATGTYATVNEDDLNNYIRDNNQAIDCYNNEELFFALAALREDNDYKQHFIYDETVYIHPRLGLQCEKGSSSFSLTVHNSGFNNIKEHKATVEELISLFEENERN